MTDENSYITGVEKQTRANTWLCEFARNVTSQYGEDGIIEKVLEVIGQNDKWCVEFGSWDGRKCSNTYNLIEAKNYSAVLIEADAKRFKELVRTYSGNQRVTTINALVGFDEADCLDRLLEKTDVPSDFDLLSIDIDGNDYHVWQAVKDYRPKVVVIEFNPTIPKEVEFVQARDVHVMQGSSLLSITKLGKTKGYELVATTTTNAIFVDGKYYDLFGIKDNSPQVMMTDESFVTYIFCGYDGTIFLRGCRMMPWQSIRLEEWRVQHLPGWACKRIGDRNFIRRKTGKIFRRLRKAGLI